MSLFHFGKSMIVVKWNRLCHPHLANKTSRFFCPKLDFSTNLIQPRSVYYFLKQQRKPCRFAIFTIFCDFLLRTILECIFRMRMCTIMISVIYEMHVSFQMWKCTMRLEWNARSIWIQKWIVLSNVKFNDIHKIHYMIDKVEAFSISMRRLHWINDKRQMMPIIRQINSSPFHLMSQ